jgi:hypothetical protein
LTVDGLRGDLRTVAEAAEWHGWNFMYDAEPDQETLADALADFMAVYCQTGALFAADWYNTRDKESRYFARPVMVVPPQRAEDTAAWVFKGGQTVENLARRTAAAAYSMVYDAARDTVSANAVKEGVAYVRVEEPGACQDCMGKATLTPRGRNSSSEDVSWDRHQRCEFLFEPVRSGIWTPPAHHSEWREKIVAGAT